jgi:hypothetical protein
MCLKFAVSQQPRLPQAPAAIYRNIDLSPEVPEAIRSHFRIPSGMLNIAMAKIMLKGSRVVTVIGELVTARVAQHVRMDREWHSSSLAEPLDKPMEADGAHRPTTL